LMFFQVKQHLKTKVTKLSHTSQYIKLIKSD